MLKVGEKVVMKTVEEYNGPTKVYCEEYDCGITNMAYFMGKEVTTIEVDDDGGFKVEGDTSILGWWFSYDMIKRRY